MGDACARQPIELGDPVPACRQLLVRRECLCLVLDSPEAMEQLAHVDEDAPNIEHRRRAVEQPVPQRFSAITT